LASEINVVDVRHAAAVAVQILAGVEHSVWRSGRRRGIDDIFPAVLAGLTVSVVPVVAPVGEVDDETVVVPGLRAARANLADQPALEVPNVELDVVDDAAELEVGQ
jgi:hypothetical protein